MEGYQTYLGHTHVEFLLHHNNLTFLRNMGGSESRFLISPYEREGEQNLYWHAPTNLRSDEPIRLTKNTGPEDRLAKVLLKKDGGYTNIRFDQHPQPYVALGADQETVVFQDTYEDSCKWYVLTIGIREQGATTWSPVERSMTLAWDSTEKKEILAIFVSKSRQVLLREGRSKVVAMDLPLIGDDPINDDDLLHFVSRSMFVVKTVDHSWSAHEMFWGMMGGVTGLTLTPYFIPIFTAVALGSSTPFFLRYPLEMGDNSMHNAETLANIGLGVEYVISSLCG